jgi:hypothetical protein
MSHDLIKRSDAIKATWQKPTYTDPLNILTEVRDRIEIIPSADRPQGEWKPKNHHTDYCSNCGFEETQWRTADYNYCPSCGARMKGVDDETD